MSDCKWLHIDKQKPTEGQRCLVFDCEVNEVIIAYWDAQDQAFYDWSNREPMLIGEAWWMPQPEPPIAESDE